MPIQYKQRNTKKPVVARKGLVIGYIGNGKGKTSAAMGLAARAAGAGMNVFILQFVKAARPKDGDKLESGEWPISNEIHFFEKVSGSGVGKIETAQVGAGFVGILGDKKEKDQHIREALKGLEMARGIITEGRYTVVILDEILSAVELDLLTQNDILDIIAMKPEMTHLVMTGHEKFPALFKKFDLVTEMNMIKHPYYDNVLAQKGIDY